MPLLGELHPDCTQDHHEKASEIDGDSDCTELKDGIAKKKMHAFA